MRQTSPPTENDERPAVTDRVPAIAPPGAGNGRRRGTTADVATTLGLDERGKRRSIFRRPLLWWALAAVAAGAIGVYWVRSRRAVESPTYATTAAKRGDIVVTVTATGTLAPLDTVDVGTEVSGVVDVVAVDYNDRVRKGQILAVVNTDQIDAEILQRKSALAAAEAAADQASASLAEVIPQAERAESLFTNRFISAQDLESARASLARARAASASAKAQVAGATAALQVQQTALSKATIRSPIDGVVLRRAVEPGRTVAAAFQTPVLFVLAADLERMSLTLDIDEADVGRVRAGQPAEFTVDAYPDRTYSATLRAVHNSAKTVEGVVTYQALLDVRNPDRSLRPGMTATASIRTMEVKDVLVVPNAALRFVPSSDTATAAASGTKRRAGPRVWTLANGTPTPVEVTTGATDGTWTQIVSGDVRPGMPLVVNVADTTATSATRSLLPFGRGPGRGGP